MTRDKLEKHLAKSKEDTQTKQQLRAVVAEVAEYVPTEGTRALMYGLVDTVLSMGERIRDLEDRMVSYSVREELARQQRTREEPVLTD
jgi:hypothetical protein